MALPASICLKSSCDNKYLRYRTEDGLLQASGDTITDPYAYFQVEESKKWPGLFNIKSSYNNLYLTRRSCNETWITASAKIPNEDLNSWSSTCFRAFPVEYSCKAGPEKIRIVHAQLGNYLRIRNDACPPYNYCLDAQSSCSCDEGLTDVFVVLDMDQVPKLPKYVAFKSDIGTYLGPATFLGQPSLQFSSGEPCDPKYRHEILPSTNGSVCVKSLHYGKFWRLGNQEMIVVDAEDPRATNQKEAMFRPVVVDVNVVGLVNVANGKFCKRFSVPGRVHSFTANIASLDQYGRLRITDLGK